MSLATLRRARSREDRILANQHHTLSTYRILFDESRSAVRDWIKQLVEQECVERVGNYAVLKVTEKGRRVLKGIELPLLLEPAKKRAAPKPPAKGDLWEGVDRDLFEELRKLRRKLAQERSMPAYIVFSDAALRDMARKRPCTPSEFLRISGVGDKKLEQYGEVMLNLIRRYCGSK